MPIATWCGEDLVEPAVLPSDKHMWIPADDKNELGPTFAINKLEKK